MAEALEEEFVGAILEGNMVRCDLKTKTGQKCNIKHKMGPDGKYAMKIHRRKTHERYQCSSTNEWCYKTYSSYPNARAHFLKKHSGESESTEDPRMRIALEDVSDQKAARKNVLVTDAPNTEIRNLDMESATKIKLLEDKIRELEFQKGCLEGKNNNLEKDLVASKEQSVELQRINAGHRAEIESLQRHLTNEQAEKASSRNDLSVALAENQDLRVRLRREENHRREQHEIIQELRGKIRIFCRIRAIPLEKMTHLSIHNKTVKLTQMKPSASGERPSKHEFNFDQVFGPNATQQQVFDEIKPLIQSVLDGYNVCIFTYGQTGSGKTFTMEGGISGSESEGIISRTMRYIFATCESLRALGWSYKIEASSLEIYNNRIRDLLGPPGGEHKIQTINNETVVTNLKVEEVTNEEQVQKLLAKAQQQRAVAATNCNEHSSRSHSVLRIKLTGRNADTTETSIGFLYMVDLAGSESLNDSGATGDRLTETQSIGKSLTSLGKVIKALKDKEKHIPYRDSKLTKLLEQALSGNSKTLMFVNISPKASCANETLTSLRFAAQVNACQKGPAVKNS